MTCAPFAVSEASSLLVYQPSQTKHEGDRTHTSHPWSYALSILLCLHVMPPVDLCSSLSFADSDSDPNPLALLRRDHVYNTVSICGRQTGSQKVLFEVAH